MKTKYIGPYPSYPVTFANDFTESGFTSMSPMKKNNIRYRKGYENS